MVERRVCGFLFHHLADIISCPSHFKLTIQNVFIIFLNFYPFLILACVTQLVLIWVYLYYNGYIYTQTHLLNSSCLLINNSLFHVILEYDMNYYSLFKSVSSFDLFLC